MNVQDFFGLSQLSITLVVGNPHTVVFTFRIEPTDIQTLGAAIYVHEFLSDDSLWLQQDVRKAVGAQGSSGSMHTLKDIYLVNISMV